MKNAITGLLVAAALLGSGAHGRAQNTLPIAAEVRLDAGIPVGQFADATSAGLGWSVGGSFDLSPTFLIYGDYSRFDFDVKDSDLKARDDGFDVGGRVFLGTGGGVWTPFAQFGALFHNGETGFEAGLGANYPVGNGIALTPLARYRSISGAHYFGIGVGLSLRP
jgi:hypothetical protein